MRFVVLFSFILIGILIFAGYPGRAIQVVNYSYVLYTVLALWKVAYENTK